MKKEKRRCLGWILQHFQVKTGIFCAHGEVFSYLGGALTTYLFVHCRLVGSTVLYFLGKYAL